MAFNAAKVLTAHGKRKRGGRQFVWKIFLGFEGFFTLANIENSIVTYIERYIYIKHY